jgi:hypothetical protein
MNSKLTKHATIKINIECFEGTHEPAIGDSQFSAGCINPYDPKLTHHGLFALAIAVGKRIGTSDFFPCISKQT